MSQLANTNAAKQDGATGELGSGAGFGKDAWPLPARTENADGSTSRVFDVSKIRIGPWNEYPIGTRAVAIGGGHWYRTARGWKWNGPDGCGSTFPTPGADVSFVLLPNITSQRIRPDVTDHQKPSTNNRAAATDSL